MLRTLSLHRNKLVLIFGLALCSLLGSIWVGDAKTWAEIDWLDVLGEGGSSIAIGVWMVLILGSRPAGRVTDLLTLGMGFMFIAMWQDNLDEFIRIPAEQWWDHWLESGAMPLGIAFLTYGLFHWHSEQLSINRQLEKREQLFREHRYIDGLTQLGRVDYLRQQLERQQAANVAAPISLIMAGIEFYPDVVRRIGHREADRLLREVAEIIMLNLRRQDVICRYAGDRFALVLPSTDAAQALKTARELVLAVQHFAFKTATGETLYQRLHTGIYTAHQGESAEHIIISANAAMEKAGEHNGCCQVA
ncbi:MAG: GGDEF domain-containing protein [Oceanospirillaceae bacterium]|nr:GGDEF domain-containing protein [Oceanospirillaceae bacterium]MBT14157.1 GGDEF domain-containing protein [Oceanospirillaceae bacterium]|tara:strand:+ start:8387 stop:9301 length:915 start_codon:yes stop_codon:yes gene_type:complete